MTPETDRKTETELGRRASIAADIAGYLLAAGIIAVMFLLSGAFS